MQLESQTFLFHFILIDYLHLYCYEINILLFFGCWSNFYPILQWDLLLLLLDILWTKLIIF